MSGGALSLPFARSRAPKSGTTCTRRHTPESGTVSTSQSAPLRGTRQRRRVQPLDAIGQASSLVRASILATTAMYLSTRRTIARTCPTCRAGSWPTWYSMWSYHGALRKKGVDCRICLSYVPHWYRALKCRRDSTEACCAASIPRSSCRE